MINIYRKYIEKNKKYIIIALLFIFLIIGIIIVKQFDTEEKESLELISIEEETEQDNKSIEEEEDYKIVVHITGEVEKEGIIAIKEGGRISDAIDAAGGLTKEADLERVNLAYELEDGQKIYIPNKNDKDIEEYVTEGVDDIVLPDELSNMGDGLININKADLEELQELDGIGEALAENIIAYRENNGKFKNIEDIKNVSGIGDSKYEKIKDSIKIR